METNLSSYLLIFRETSPDIYKAMSPSQRQHLLEQWNAWVGSLVSQGKMQHGHPLEPQGRVVSGPRGERVVDGPFAETTEAIGGYFLLTVAGLDEATEIAQHCPSLPFGINVEVRPVAEVCATLGVRARDHVRAEFATA
jgi:hypothetical protein